MQHPDPDVIALRALGRPGDSGEDEQHLSTCARCQSDLDQLRAVVATARLTTAEDRPTDPPAAVWDRILSDLGPDLGVRTDRRVAFLRRPSTASPRWLVTVAAAVAGLLAGVGGTAITLGSDDGRPPVSAAPTSGPSAAGSPGGPGSPPVVAEARLAALGRSGARGTADVVGTGPGRRLQVVVRGLPSRAGFYEVWLLDRSASRLVSLGVLSSGHATLPLPEGLDITRFPVVDVSLEPFDGDPAHSKNSVVRGSLRA